MNPALEVIRKAVPWLILAGVVGAVAGILFKFLIRRGVETCVDLIKGKNGVRRGRTRSADSPSRAVPSCPECGKAMVKRTARKANANGIQVL